MKQEDREKIEQIMGEMQCPKNFKCAESGFENVCKANDSGMDDFLLCLEKDPTACKFVVPYGTSNYCRCPLRVYLAKKLMI
ncbi:hypothetical protein ACFL9T_02105 [Thermodesulfobacteriota bacterium]